MRLKIGDGEIDITKESDGFMIWIDHMGVGDDGTATLNWVSGASAEEMRRLADAIRSVIDA